LFAIIYISVVMKNFVLNIQTLINFLILVTTSYGDIRCHCNLPQCVRTGYMCKSTGASAACYSEQPVDVNVDGISSSDHISRHGCIELPQQLRDMCVKPLPQSPPLQSHHNHHNHRHHNSNQSIICCFEDMCNYVKNIDLIFSTRTHTIYNDNKLVGTATSSTRNIPNLSNSVWFQVTVITVPIAGSILLVILIVMAIKVLRQDNKRHEYNKKITSLTHVWHLLDLLDHVITPLYLYIYYKALQILFKYYYNS